MKQTELKRIYSAISANGFEFNGGSQKKEREARIIFAYVCKIRTEEKLNVIAAFMKRTKSATSMMIKQAVEKMKEENFSLKIKKILEELDEEKEMAGLGMLAQRNYEI